MGKRSLAAKHKQRRWCQKRVKGTQEEKEGKNWINCKHPYLKVTHFNMSNVEKIVSPPHTVRAPPATTTAATRNCLTHFELRSIEIYVNFSVCVRVRVCEAVTLWVFFRTRLSLCHIWNYARFFSAVFFPSPFLRKEKILLPYFRICFMFMMQTKGSKQTKKETQRKRSSEPKG